MYMYSCIFSVYCTVYCIFTVKNINLKQTRFIGGDGEISQAKVIGKDDILI